MAATATATATATVTDLEHEIVARMPRLRHNISFWDSAASRRRRDEQQSKKRKSCEDEGLVCEKTISLNNGSDDESLDEIFSSAAHKYPSLMRRSPSNSTNSESMFSEASTHVADEFTSSRRPYSNTKSTPAHPPKRQSKQQKSTKIYWLDAERGGDDAHGPIKSYGSNPYA